MYAEDFKALGNIGKTIMALIGAMIALIFVANVLG